VTDTGVMLNLLVASEIPYPTRNNNNSGTHQYVYDSDGELAVSLKFRRVKRMMGATKWKMW
jgi:hypothetical protein